MDKFANGDETHPDAEEYVTVQSCIDNAKDKGVFVLATVNNRNNLPKSLLRMGRFDKQIKVDTPTGQDAIEIISYYLKSKKIVETLDATTLARILEGYSCAEIETLINEAGNYAGYRRENFITMEHILEALMRSIYKIPKHLLKDNSTPIDVDNPNELLAKIAYHEAGHTVVHEVLCPQSITLVCAYNKHGRVGGFTDCYTESQSSPLNRIKTSIVCSLGGMAGVENKFGVFDEGVQMDIEKAIRETANLATEIGYNGINFCNFAYGENSEKHKATQENIVFAEVSKYYQKAKEIVARNREFLDKIAHALAQKKFLTGEDVQEIKKTCNIVSISL